MTRKQIVTEPKTDFADPTFAGVRGLEMVARAIEVVRAALIGAGSICQATRKDFAFRQGFSGLDRHRLRDLGIDRSSA